jgi:Na+-transporting methylmalonyl-CoA/oxaloacetate decarboxylase gamma subunit
MLFLIVFIYVSFLIGEFVVSVWPSTTPGSRPAVGGFHYGMNRGAVMVDVPKYGQQQEYLKKLKKERKCEEDKLNE